MARVVPVGPLDAELYGFAKKEAERAERDPRYKPKNCPAERGQIIYKRIGAMVKALVIATPTYTGDIFRNVRSSLPIFEDLGDAYEKIKSLSAFDDSGNISEGGYFKGMHIGVLDNVRGGIRHYIDSESTYLRDGQDSGDYWWQSASVVGTDMGHVEFYRQYLDEDGRAEIKKIAEYAAAPGATDDASFSSGWINAYDPPHWSRSTFLVNNIYAAVLKGDDYFLLVQRSSNTSYSGPLFATGTNYDYRDLNVDVVVNGEVVRTIFMGMTESTSTYQPSGPGTGSQQTVYGNFGTAGIAIPRTDAGGLGYVSDALGTNTYPTYPTASYRTIANKFGIFLAHTSWEYGGRITWIKPLEVEEDPTGKAEEEQGQEGGRLKISYLLHDADAAERGGYDLNSEVIIISIPTPTAWGYLITRGASPNDVILMDSESGKYIDLSEIIRQYANKEIDKSELEAWRPDEDAPPKKFPGVYPQTHPPGIMPIPLLKKADKKIAKMAKEASEGE